MEKYMSEEEYNKELEEIRRGLSEVNQDIEKINYDASELQKTYENISTAQGIVNTLSEMAEIVNNTVNPMEFFDGYEKMYYLVDKLESVPNIEYSQQPPNEIREELQGQRKPAIEKMIGRYYKYAMSMNYSTDVFYNTLSRYFYCMDNDHKNYINQLCKNGNKNKSDYAKKIRKFKEFYMNFSYIINRILFPPAKAIFILWTFSWISSLPADKETSFWQKIIIVLFGYFIMCGIADLIYIRNKQRYNKYLIKNSEKKIKRLKKLMQEEDPMAYQRDYGNKSNPTNIQKNTVNYDYMNGHEFEYFCADVLRKNGFKNVEVTQGSGDHGIDILAEKDGITYAIQCKCYSSNIGNAAVQQAHTGKSLYHKDIAVVLTNRYFTLQAKQEAEQLGVKLWDRDKLNEMIKNEV